MPTSHPPEPWHTSHSYYGEALINGKPSQEGVSLCLATMRRDAGQEIADAAARRAVACVNGCAGINPEAVPDMLEACKLALRHFPALFDEGTDAPNPVEVLRAAIAKAGG